MPLVSVIVPTYNRAHMVPQTIDAVLSQTLIDLELIVVDNESVDNTEEVVKSYQDTRIKYFKNQNNGVVAVNRNFGIRESQGEYISFCDDDDVWIPEKLERQLLEFQKDKRVGLVCTNAREFDEYSEKGTRIKRKLRDSDFTLESLIVEGNRIISSSVVVRRTVLDDIGTLDESPEIFSSEDYELWARVASKYTIKYIDRPLLNYRLHLAAHSQTRSPTVQLQYKEAVLRKLLGKEIITHNMYQKGLTKQNRQLLLQRLFRYDWMMKIAFLIDRILSLLLTPVMYLIKTIKKHSNHS